MTRWMRERFSMRPRVSGEPPARFPISPAITGAWFGMVSGLAESALSYGWRWGSGEIVQETLFTNWHAAWMIPVCNLAVLGSLGILLGLIVWAIPNARIARASQTLLCGIAIYSLVLNAPYLHKNVILFLSIALTWRTVKVVDVLGARFRRSVLLSFPFLGATVAGLVVIHGTSVARFESREVAALPPASPTLPNVLLIVLDTVRADAMSAFGSSRDTTPHLAKLADQGARFHHARTPAPWTLPAHASLFTGQWPHELSANVGKPLDTRDLTIAEHLARRGYTSAAFVANTHNGNAWYGLDRGFARYEDLYENSRVSAVEVLRSSRLGRKILMSRTGQRVIKSLVVMPKYLYRKTAAMVNRDMLAWLDRQQDDRPFFAFLNYYDVHDPYVVPKGAPRPFAEQSQVAPRSTLAAARDDYDDCLRYLDDQVGKLLAELERRGETDNTLILITSDHGEAFGEHDLAGHGISLYRPELHVPLIVVDPRRVPQGRSVTAPVSIRDIPATIADLLADGSTAPFPGQSLANLWTDAAPASRDPILSSVDRSAKVSPLLTNAPARLGRMFSLLHEGRHYIRNGDGREELYDHESDPGETNDLANSPEVEDEMNRHAENLRLMVRDLD